MALKPKPETRMPAAAPLLGSERLKVRGARSFGFRFDPMSSLAYLWFAGNEGMEKDRLYRDCYSFSPR